MMYKVLGAALVFGGCGGFGFAMAAACRREEGDLRQLIRALEYMSCELSYRQTPLPQLCRSAASIATGTVAHILTELSRQLEGQLAPDAQVCMHEALEKTRPGPVLGRLLSELGATLGRFDLPGQLRGLDGSLRAAELALREHRQGKGSRLRSYQTLGLCAGAALAILFL